jgi:hypothetical protein
MPFDDVACHRQIEHETLMGSASKGIFNPKLAF